MISFQDCTQLSHISGPLYLMEIDCAASQILNNGLCSISNLRCCTIDSLYHHCYRAPYNCLLVLHNSVLTGHISHKICHEPNMECPTRSRHKVKVRPGTVEHRDPFLTTPKLETCSTDCYSCKYLTNKILYRSVYINLSHYLYEFCIFLLEFS